MPELVKLAILPQYANDADVPTPSAEQGVFIFARDDGVYAKLADTTVIGPFGAGGADYLTEAEGDARYAPIHTGVTNGDLHNHDGSDGGPIPATSIIVEENGFTGILDPIAFGETAQDALDLIDSIIPEEPGISDGWVGANETWTYAGADDPTYTFTVAGDKTTKYSAGMRIKLTQTTVKYFIVTKVAYSSPNTTVTIYGGTDYDLADETIEAPYYSMVKAPMGFPLDPIKWTFTVTDTSNRQTSTPTNGTWYNPGSISGDIPIGAWLLGWSGFVLVYDASAGTWGTYLSLSTANNAESDAELTAGVLAASLNQIAGSLSRSKYVNLAAKTTYYVIQRTLSTGLDTMQLRGDISTTTIKAVCAYV